jgi:aminopeptidase N
MKRKESEVNVLKESIASMQTVIETAARRASEHARTSMLKQADLLTRAAEELRAGAEITSEAAVQAVVASRRGCDETVESLLKSLDSDREAFSDLADAVAATSERGFADFMSKHARELTSVREQFSTELTSAVRQDVPTGATPARDSARALLAEPVTPSAFAFRPDEALRAYIHPDSADLTKRTASRAPLSPLNNLTS